MEYGKAVKEFLVITAPENFPSEKFQKLQETASEIEKYLGYEVLIFPYGFDIQKFSVRGERKTKRKWLTR